MMQPNDTYTKMEAHFYNNGLMQTYSPPHKQQHPHKNKDTDRGREREREREGLLETRGLNFKLHYLSFSKKKIGSFPFWAVQNI